MPQNWSLQRFVELLRSNHCASASLNVPRRTLDSFLVQLLSNCTAGKLLFLQRPLLVFQEKCVYWTYLNRETQSSFFNATSRLLDTLMVELFNFEWCQTCSKEDESLWCCHKYMKTWLSSQDWALVDAFSPSSKTEHSKELSQSCFCASWVLTVWPLPTPSAFSCYTRGW